MKTTIATSYISGHPVSSALPNVNKRQLAEFFNIVLVITLTKNKKQTTRLLNVLANKGFIWDGMSIPRFAWSFIGGPFYYKHIIAGLVHDWLYTAKICTRKEADLIMLHLLKERGVSKINQQVMYRSVRAFGWLAWRGKNKNY